MSKLSSPFRSQVSAIQYVPLGVLAAVFVIFDLALATMLGPGRGEQGGIILGLVFSQITLFAVWSALGPTSVFSRLVMSLAASSLVALALVACVSRIDVGGQGFLWFGIVLAQWLMIQIPLWIIRLAFGWRMSWPNESIQMQERDVMQFGIRQLLAWTALVAMTLGGCCCRTILAVWDAIRAKGPSFSAR